MRRIRLSLLCWVILVGLLGRTALAQQGFENMAGKHFIVYYPTAQDRDFARKVLNEAERSYKRIGALIGYTRYRDFWTWDERVKIIIFPSQEVFVKVTGKQEWSLGFVDRDALVFKTRSIFTYLQEEGMIENLLPHEISHLILADYIPSQSIPVWLDEGLAQMNESQKRDIVPEMMRVLVTRKQYVPFEMIMKANIRMEKDPQKVQIFYAQSLSMVEFIKNSYGAEAFRRLFRQMRDGQGFMDALRIATRQQIRSVAEFEESWVRDVLK